MIQKPHGIEKEAKPLKKVIFHRVLTAALAAAMLLTILSGCGGKKETPEPAAPTQSVPTAAPAETAKPTASPATQAPAPASDSDLAGAEEPTPAPVPASDSDLAAQPVKRSDGERFVDVIVLEGMEEAVAYEHIRSEALGLEMDYDYAQFVRRSEADRERIISDWDDPESPENYLELTRSAQDAQTVADAISETLSATYEISREAFTLEGAGECIRIDASADKGGQTMPDRLQMVYIIPAADGCRVAAAHYAIEGAEGYGRRFAYMVHTLTVID